MNIRIRSKNILKNGVFSEGEIFLCGGVIRDNLDASMPIDTAYDFGENYVVPGLIDIHTHGAVGIEYADAGVEDILKVVAFQRSHGASAVMPTVTSVSFDQIREALENIRIAMKEPTIGSSILGVHIEGPYFSEKHRGAQDARMLTVPQEEDYAPLIAEYGDIIKRWDYAPELDAEGKFGAYLCAHGILPSAAHTDAKYGDMCTARENGCRLITHLYSCMSTITREMGFRILGVIECAYLWDDMYVELIADGRHLPYELLKLTCKLKPHDKIILVTDSLKVTGSGEKYSSVGTTPCVIEDGVCKLLDRSAFAGSIATADILVKTMVEAGVDLAEAIRMASENPAALFGLNKGKIADGYDGDLVIFDPSLQVKQVFVKGVSVYDDQNIACGQT